MTNALGGDEGSIDPMLPWVEDTSTEAGWDAIRQSYADGNRVEALEQIIRLAKSHGVQSVVIERRYVDADWRSMFAKFYGSLFQRYAPTCHRLHLFSEMVSRSEDLSLYGDAYKGFTILRPIPSHPVGRTMIKPPPGLSRETFCLAPETVRPLGYPLHVEAMPFMSQDGEYMRCSHVVQWMVLHHAHLLRNFARRLPEDIQLRSQGGLVVGRQVPSGGLSLPQMLSSLHALGLSPDKVLLPHGGQEGSSASQVFSLPATLCRYVNSQMPPIVISEAHAWVVVGYRNRGSGRAHDTTSFYVHDDIGGPYVEISDPWAKEKAFEEAKADEEARHRDGSNADAAASDRAARARREWEKCAWSLTVPPLPQRVNLSADRAEFVGRFSLMRVAEQPPKSRRLRAALDGHHLTFRTYAIRSNEFKATMKGRGLPPDLCAHYRRANWPGFIWVVEALDRRRFEAAKPCVMGEAIIDSTATHMLAASRRESAWPARAVLAVHVPGKAELVRGPGFSDPEPFEVSYDNGDSGTGRPLGESIDDRGPKQPREAPLVLAEERKAVYYPLLSATRSERGGA